MMLARYAGRHLARVMGYAVMPILIAPLLGPVIAGNILQHASWRWLFYLNLPVGVLALVLAMILLPQDDETKRRRVFDLGGFLLLSPGLALLLYGLEYAAPEQRAVESDRGCGIDRRLSYSRWADARASSDRHQAVSRTGLFRGGSNAVSVKRWFIRGADGDTALPDRGMHATCRRRRSAGCSRR